LKNAVVDTVGGVCGDLFVVVLDVALAINIYSLYNVSNNR
jgi:hypothetical protein